MKKVLVALLVVLAVFCILQTKTSKNFIGHSLGFGDCPNCEDNWWWKKYGYVWYETGSGVLICDECLRHPETLNLQKIKMDLIKHGWKPEKADRAIQDIERYKEEKSKVLL